MMSTLGPFIPNYPVCISVGSEHMQYQAPQGISIYNFAPPMAQPASTAYLASARAYDVQRCPNPPPREPALYSRSHPRFRDRVQPPRHSSQPASLQSYADQLNAAYYAYQQQQDIYKKQQRELLRCFDRNY
uniref:Uncharacterized protein n=1 Tax=Glossina palpalis gambiensis TaxID=67801 RepID=A0A1B0C1M6_9MUSC